LNITLYDSPHHDVKYVNIQNTTKNLQIQNHKKILVYCDTRWAIGRIYKDVDKYLNNEFSFTYYDWAKHSPDVIIPLIKEYDICITNLVIISHFKSLDISSDDLKKTIFSCHGFAEFNHLKDFSFPTEPIYSITSNSISSLFPENMQPDLIHTYNGVELSNFNYVKRNGNIEKIGWCGNSLVDWKRSNWAIDISNKTNLLLSFATSLSYDDLKLWYNKIDVLLINSGPEYWKETGPLPAFEAIASGVLVIGTSVGNFAEVPGPKYATVDEAIEILLELKQDSDKVKQLANEQYEYVKNHLSYEVLANQWREMYRKI